jgi:glycosyltransferase involved in cell wall biosynthesis
MSNGLPVIATRTGGNPELVSDETGILVNVNNPTEISAAVEQLRVNPAQRHALGKNGRQRYCREFTEDQMFARYEDLYRIAAAGIRRENVVS